MVVVEAADRSGTLITARLALEQGRDVFAVPGSPLDPRCAGTNRLLKDGALLVREAADIIDVAGAPMFRLYEPDHTPPYCFDEAEDDRGDPKDLRATLLRLLSVTPIHRDVLLRETSTSPAQLADVLLDLSLEGITVESDGGCFALSPYSDATTESI